MYQTLEKRLARHLVKHSVATSTEIYLYLISYVATGFCAAVHLYLLCVFAFSGMHFLVGVNTVSVLVYAVLLVLVSRRAYTVVALCITFEVSIYAVLFSFFAGASTYVLGYFLLVSILQVILPYGTVRLRVGAFASAMLLLAVGAGFHLLGTATVAFAPWLQNLLFISNIVILFLGTMVQLLIGNVIQNIIEHTNESRMAELSTLANTDPLTGLYNRRYAESYMAEIRKAGSKMPYSVAMLDIDDFKLVNDTWGHPCGDEVLVFLGKYITASLRKTDRVFRWGGEEFLIVLENADTTQAGVVLEKLRIQLEAGFVPTKRKRVRITVTIGVAPLDPEDPGGSIRRCDENLYRGKQGGKNKVVA